MGIKGFLYPSNWYIICLLPSALHFARAVEYLRIAHHFYELPVWSKEQDNIYEHNYKYKIYYPHFPGYQLNLPDLSSIDIRWVALQGVNL